MRNIGELPQYNRQQQKNGHHLSIPSPTKLHLRSGIAYGARARFPTLRMKRGSIWGAIPYSSLNYPNSTGTLPHATRFLLPDLNFNLIKLFLLQTLDFIICQERLLCREQQRSGSVHSGSDKEPEKPSDVEEVGCSADVDFRVDGIDETWKEGWDGCYHC